MRRLRRKYYDWFSSVYDQFVALHSSDRQGRLRGYLSEQTGTGEGDRLLDICTGTAALLTHLKTKVGKGGLVVGADFSRGMLRVAQGKTSRLSRVCLVQADVSRLPFKSGSFEAVTCAHAFYEIKGEAQDHCLNEIRRVLKGGGAFLMLEHDVPENPLVRMLFYLRLLSMGPGRALQILKHEQALLGRYFAHVTRVRTPTGRSKILICRNSYP